MFQLGFTQIQFFGLFGTWVRVETNIKYKQHCKMDTV